MAGPHDKIVAAAARAALQPIGFRRKGQSRTWIGDQGWWLAVVEFQPSGLQKGSFLNVAAHWLWSASGYISFDLGCGEQWGSRVAGFEAYVSDEQFQPAADRLAARAAREAQDLVASISSIATAADMLIARLDDLPPANRGSWAGYHAGVASGLAGRPYEAAALLQSVTDDRVKEATEPFINALPDAGRFKAAASLLVASQRKMLRLPEASDVSF